MSATPRPSTRPARPAAGTLRRALGRDRNPLCRSADAARSRFTLFLVLCLAASVAAAALTFVHSLDGLRAETRRLAPHRHEVTATLLSPAPDGSTTTVLAPARWPTPPGSTRTGPVTVPTGTEAGETVPLWVDDDGAPAAAPRPDRETVLLAALRGAAVLAVAVTALGLGRTAGHRAFDRRAARSWEADWEKIEPQWTGRR